MPELPEVENVRRSLESKIVGRTIDHIEFPREELATRIVKFNDLQEFVLRLRNKVIVSISRRGKFLIIKMENTHQGKENLIVHLGMTGAFLHSDGDYSIYPDTIKNHIFVKITLDDSNQLIYSDYRRFGSLRVVTEEELHHALYSHLKTLQTMGPEPFDEDAEDIFLENIRHKRYTEKPIKDVLLDQRVIAGVGNIYACEALAKTGVYPLYYTWAVSDGKLREIFQAIKKDMLLSIELGGTSIRDYVDGEGKAGTFQDHLQVYGRTNCSECGSWVEQERINNRNTFYCPSCQPMPEED